MTGRTSIERKAEAAKRTLLTDRRKGEELFAGLLKQDRSEGVIFLKRGEVWELLGEPALAVRDFRIAAELLRDSQWQNLARQARERVGSQAMSYSATIPEPSSSEVPDPSVTAACHEALEMAVEHPRAAAARCRTVLEKLVQQILRLNEIAYSPSADLAALLDLLRQKDLANGDLLANMHAIRVLADGAGRGEPFAEEDGLVAGTALLAVFKDAFPTLGRQRLYPLGGEMPAFKTAEAAALIYDSSSSPAAEGFRAAAGLRVRKRLYQKARFYIDIETDPPGESDRASVVGQVLDAENHMAVPDARIILRSGKEAIAQTTTSELGEFSLEYQEAKDLSFLVELNDGQRFVVPLSGPENP